LDVLPPYPCVMFLGFESTVVHANRQPATANPWSTHPAIKELILKYFVLLSV
jgi:hypothetical protein